MSKEQNVQENGDTSRPKINQKPSSFAKANFLSKTMFFWNMPLFWRGLKNDLSVPDLSRPMKADVSENVANKLERNWFQEIIKSRDSRRNPSLFRALFKTFIYAHLWDGVAIFLQSIICKSFQPLFLALLVEYFAPQSETTKEMAYAYAAGVVVLGFVSLFFTHHSTLHTQQLGMRIRIGCCSLIYRKMLRLNGSSLGKTTAGQLVNLMSNDVSRFDQVMSYTHYLWIMPIQVLLVCYLIYTRVQTSALIGVASITLQTLPIQGYLSRISARLRKKIATRTDERVRIMNEIINGIQVIKMYAWEKPFEKIVSSARAHELSVITKTSYLRGIYMSFMVFTERATLFVTLLAYSFLGHSVTSATVFSLAQYYNILQQTMAILFPNTLSSIAECKVTIKRLQEFLLMEERPDLEVVPIERSVEKLTYASPENNKEFSPSGKQSYKKYDENGISNLGFVDDEHHNDDENYKVDIQNVTACWENDVHTLEDITIRVPQGNLCAIIGSVGSGKSSILQLLLKELPIKSGSVQIRGKYSYASQEAWLFVDTVRNNILFGLPYDNKRYREVVRVCALEKDFQQFPRGDMTLVGERGVSLSGGQRARINLARAVYRKADVYLLDDPLSAVDAHVGRHLFNECISNYLKTKTVILVTHQLHYLRTANTIVILKNGRLESMGSYDELASSGENFSHILSLMQETKMKDDNEDKLNTIKVRRSVSQVSRASTCKSEHDDDEEAQELEEEELIKGRMNFSVYLQYWKSGGHPLFIFTMVLVMLLGQLSASLADYWVTFWTNQENMLEKSRNSTYTFNLYDNIGPFNTIEYLYIYTIIIALCVCMTISRSILFFKVCMNSSKNLHDTMFNKILKGVMHFFDTNPSGRILNRFSKDIGAIDELLPKATIEAVQIFLVMVSILVLVSITNPWMVIPVVVILVLFYFIFVLYLSTAQDIKRIEGITRSPVFSHVSASLNGLTTIRSADAVGRLIKEFDVHQDLHTSAWYEYISCSCALGFWLDVFCVLFLTIVSFSFILFQSDMSLSGNVGLAISQSMILTGMLQYGVRQTAEIVSQMTSVERVMQYNKIEHEMNLDKGDMETPQNWPSKGEVVFEGMNLKYTKIDPPVLKDLNIYIKNGWKVGIVGRTGAGKSSLIAALFRLARIEGDIKIDSVETGQLALQDLRSRISIIPQEPVLFSASMRYNLDPFDKYDDASIWDALESVELKEAVETLDYKVSEGGSNFSLGQRQLICLARAILRNNKILVLDEATANVDPQTDAFIQKTIRIKFKECTVLTIAHRLNTIMDSDRVLVMDSGRMVEFDHPYLLLKNNDGHLSKMVAETGHEMSKTLHRVAREAYEDTGANDVEYDLKEE